MCRGETIRRAKWTTFDTRARTDRCIRTRPLSRARCRRAKRESPARTMRAAGAQTRTIPHVASLLLLPALCYIPSLFLSHILSAIGAFQMRADFITRALPPPVCTRSFAGLSFRLDHAPWERSERPRWYREQIAKYIWKRRCTDFHWNVILAYLILKVNASKASYSIYVSFAII